MLDFAGCRATQRELGGTINLLGPDTVRQRGGGVLAQHHVHTTGGEPHQLWWCHQCGVMPREIQGITE